MKRALIFLTVLAVLSLSGKVFAGTYPDVPEGHWAYDAIERLYEEGLMEGYADGTFKGQRNMTRFEVAIILARIVDTLTERIAALEEKVGIISKKPEEKVETEEEKKVEIAPGKLVTSEELAELKKIVEKLSADLKDELADIASLGKEQKSLWEKIAGLEGVEMGAEIRVRPIKVLETNSERKVSVIGQRSRLIFTQRFKDEAEIKLQLKSRANWPGGESVIVEIATARAKTPFGTFTVGRQPFQFGPFGLLVRNNDNNPMGSVIGEREEGGILLTGVAGFTRFTSPSGEADKYIAGRGSYQLKKGEVGVNLLLKGEGSLKNSYGLDFKFDPLGGEFTQIKDEEEEKATAFVVGVNLIRKEKMNAQIKYASIDTDFSPSYSILSLEEDDKEGILTSGFKGFGVSLSLEGKDIVVTGELCKSSESVTFISNGVPYSGRAGLVRVTLSYPLSLKTLVSLRLEQIGKNDPVRLVRGELMMRL